MLPFMVYGLFLSAGRKHLGPGSHFLNLLTSPAGFLILFTIIYASIHLLTWALIRYRLPIDAVLIPFAAFALFDIFERVRRKNEKVRLELGS